MAYIKDSPNTRTAPEWLGKDLDPECLVPAGGILDITKFPAQDAINVVVGVGGAAQNATSIPVTALVDPLPTPIATYTVPLRILIPVGTVLYFGGQKVATVTVGCLAGDTAIVCSALPTALVAGDKATFAGYGRLFIAVPSGTVVGRTLADRNANNPFHPALITDDELYFVAFDKSDLSKDASVDLVIPKEVVIYENMLPQYTALTTAVNELQTVTISGILSAGVIVFRDGLGNEVSATYNANQAAIQTAFDTLYGATNTVITGTMASFTVAFTAALAGLPQTRIAVEGGGATGYTHSSVVQTTPGGTALMIKLRGLLQNSGLAYN